jgi:hypothetical protein
MDAAHFAGPGITFIDPPGSVLSVFQTVSGCLTECKYWLRSTLHAFYECCQCISCIRTKYEGIRLQWPRVRKLLILQVMLYSELYGMVCAFYLASIGVGAGFHNERKVSLLNLIGGGTNHVGKEGHTASCAFARACDGV